MKKIIVLLITLSWSGFLYAYDVNVNVRTSWRPLAEFRYVEVDLIPNDRSREGRREVTQARLNGGNYIEGERAARFERVRRGQYRLIVKLLDTWMRPIDGKIMVVDVDENKDVTIRFPRIDGDR